MSPITNGAPRLALALLLAGTALAAAAARAQDADPVGTVRVTGGLVSGTPSDTAGVQVFKGLPFAGPTEGANRFRPPQPVVPWEGVRAADHWGDQALQDVDTNPVGGFWGDEFYFDPATIPPASENGLNLNVWTPARSAGDKLPVYVWIHGGANHHGNASEIEFNAARLAAKGIVVVAIQYRVGSLGFAALPELSTENSDKVSGNQATLDQIQALQWVRDNIAGFGGDPDTVTIGGQSAGARNTAMLLRSPLAKGLFRRAVIESGSSGLFPAPVLSLAEREAASAKGIEAAFGKPMTLAELRAVPTGDFLTRKAPDNKTMLFEALHKEMQLPTSQHTLDGHVFTTESVDLLRPGALEGIDILIGGTSDEYTSLQGGPERTLDDAGFAAAMEKLGYDASWRDVYRPSDPGNAYRQSLRARADFNLQNFILAGQLAQKRNSDLDVYTFYFNHAPPGRDAEFYGSFHSSDLWYFFDSLRDQPGQRGWTGADHRMAETMSGYLANFVRTGDPNGEGLPRWEETEPGAPRFMRFRDGNAYPVSETPYSERDRLNRETAMRLQAIEAADVAP